MASPSSRRKNSTNAIVDLYERLLRDGASFTEPDSVLEQAAEALATTGVIAIHRSEFVRCANVMDRDYEWCSRSCQGQIALEDGLDEDGNDYRCPDCDRPIYPQRHSKRRFRVLRTTISVEGSDAYLAGRVAAFGHAHFLPATGVHRVDVGKERVWLCVADYYTDGSLLTADWAKVQPTCYVLVDAEAAEGRLVAEPELCRLTLAEVVSDDGVLATTLERLASEHRRPGFAGLTMPVYAPTHAPVRADEEAEPQQVVVIVETSEKSVRMNGVEVISSRGSERYRIFKRLLDQFLDDVRSCRPATEFTALHLASLTEPGVDDDAARRTVNRLQTELAEALQNRTGVPISREDVIETVIQKGQRDSSHGYRLNPLTVLVRPHQQSPESRTV